MKLNVNKDKWKLPLPFAVGLALVTTLPALASAQDTLEQTKIRGVVTPIYQANITTDLAAVISELPIKEGGHFKKGDLLARFICDRQQAELDAANAASRASRIDWNSKRELLQYKAVGANEVKLSEAVFAEARARAEGLKIQVEKCKIIAPFEGRIASLSAYEYETPSANTPLMKIISDKDIELNLIVPSTWLVWLKEGEKFSFLVDETGNKHNAQVTSLGASVDPVSQTIKITAKINDTQNSVLSGMSGTATFRKSDS